MNYNHITSAHSIKLSTLLFHMEAFVSTDQHVLSIGALKEERLLQSLLTPGHSFTTVFLLGTECFER